MDREERIARLASLTERQREVLRLRCGGLDYRAIGEELAITRRAVVSHMGNIYEKLGFYTMGGKPELPPQAERLKIMYEEYCPLLEEVELPPAPPEPEQPEPVAAIVEKEVVADDKALVPIGEIPPVPIPKPSATTKKRPRRLIWVLIGMILGVTLLGGLLWFIGFRPGTVETSEERATATPIVQTVVTEVTRLITATPEPPQPTAPPLTQSQAELDAEATRIADDIFATLTAEAPPTEAPPEASGATTLPTDAPAIAASSELGLPGGNWSIRTYRTDDANLVLVNDDIVAGTLYRQETEWINVNGSLRSDAPNYVTFVNINGQQNAKWGFALRHNDTTVWGTESEAGGCILCYTQTLQILPDNSVEEVNRREFSKDNLTGDWTARVIAEDVGVLIVNGVVVAGGYGGRDLGWIDIGPLLYSGEDNVVIAAVWNQDGDYSWDFAVRKRETIVWGYDDSGSGQVGEVLLLPVIIDGQGNLVRDQ